jgi:hypothetical protein
MATKKQNTTTVTTNSTASQDNVQMSAVVQRLDRIIELLVELNANLPLKGIDTSRFVK